MTANYLPIGVRYSYGVSDHGTERRMSVDVQPTGHERFWFAFDPFPHGYPVSFAGGSRKRRARVLRRLSIDKAIAECDARFSRSALHATERANR